MKSIVNDLGNPFMRTMYGVWEREAEDMIPKKEEVNVHSTPAHPGRVPKKHR